MTKATAHRIHWVLAWWGTIVGIVGVPTFAIAWVGYANGGGDVAVRVMERASVAMIGVGVGLLLSLAAVGLVTFPARRSP